MASTGINQGITKLTIGGTAITHLINVEYTQTNELRDVTTKDSSGNSRSFIGGILNATMSATAFFAENSAYGFEELQNACAAGTSVAVVNTSEVTGDLSWSGSGFISEVSKRSPNLDGSETIDVTIQISGAITEGTES